MVDMGVEPYLVASSLEAVLAQRLVRVLCKHCKQEDRSPAAQAFKTQVGIPANTTIYRSVGCRECRFEGYRGRVGLFELLEMDSRIREATFQRKSSMKIRDQARLTGGLKSLHFQVGTSIAEVERRLIMATLDLHGGNKRKTADILGVSLKTLYNRLNTYREA